jgi:uncharacterized protein (TIGR02271 family)
VSDRGLPGRPDPLQPDPLQTDPLLAEGLQRDERLDVDRVDEEEVTVVASEEQLVATAVEREAGKVRIRKELEEVAFDELVPYAVEHAEIERVPANADDSGDIETMADGTVSIPVLEEQLVIEKRLVVTERLLVRKRVETREQRVTADLVREVVTVDSDEDVDGRVHITDHGA